MENAFKEFSLQVKIMDSSLSLLSREYNRKKRYYDAPELLNRIHTLAKKKEYFRTLGIINKDIFSKKRNDIVFGVARLPNTQKYKEYGVALISLAQLREKNFENPKNRKKFKGRVLKEAVHELGHTFGLNHCDNECIMQFSNNLYETDKKPLEFCERCQTNLRKFFRKN